MPTLAEQVALISQASVEDLEAIWNLPTAQLGQALLDLLPSLIDTWATAAGSFTADWYDDRREEADVKGRFRAIVPDLGDLGAKELARWGAAPLDLDVPNLPLVRSRVEGGLQRRVTNMSRKTVMTSSIEDPQARGWQRMARSNGCPFCQMLAGRGFIYSEKSADFGAHDYCHCSAVPAFSGRPVPVRAYKPTDRTITDADRARTREWLASNT